MQLLSVFFLFSRFFSVCIFSFFFFFLRSRVETHYWLCGVLQQHIPAYTPQHTTATILVAIKQYQNKAAYAKTN